MYGSVRGAARKGGPYRDLLGMQEEAWRACGRERVKESFRWFPNSLTA